MITNVRLAKMSADELAQYVAKCRERLSWWQCAMDIAAEQHGIENCVYFRTHRDVMQRELDLLQRKLVTAMYQPVLFDSKETEHA